jgi:hypothetical protein
MSWMFMVFHTPLVSGVHVAVILFPSLKTFPGFGSEGVGSAKATNTRDKIKVGKARENIEVAFSEKKVEQSRWGFFGSFVSRQRRDKYKRVTGGKERVEWEKDEARRKATRRSSVEY